MSPRIKVGTVLSLHGRFAIQGRQARAGLSLWAEDVNAAGGMEVPDHGGRWPVELVVYDDESQSQRATAWAEKLIVEDLVDLLVGPYSSVLTLAVARVAESHRKVLWNHGGSSDAVTDQGFRFVVSLPSPASHYFVDVLEMVEALAPWARRLVLLQAATGTFAQSVIAGAQTYAWQHGFQIALQTSYPQSPMEFDRLVSQVVASEPDVILGVGRTEADVQFARLCRRRRVEAVLIGLVAAPIQSFREALASDADGFIGPSQWEADVGYQPQIGPTPAAFSARFRERYQTEPDYPAAQAYAAGLVAQRCIEEAGTLQDEHLRAQAHRLDLTTFYGAFKLDARTGQQIGHRLVIVQWQGNHKRVVWPEAVANAPVQILPVATARSSGTS